jgi:hypothetical protein
MKSADIMMIGYAGGGVRNIVGKKPVSNMAELKNFSIRVMGAPIQTKMFQAITAAPTVIAYDEVYNAVQTGVIMAGENEAPGWSQMKWHEVAPYISKTMPHHPPSAAEGQPPPRLRRKAPSAAHGAVGDLNRRWRPEEDAIVEFRTRSGLAAPSRTFARKSRVTVNALIVRPIVTLPVSSHSFWFAPRRRCGTAMWCMRDSISLSRRHLSGFVPGSSWGS